MLHAFGEGCMSGWLFFILRFALYPPSKLWEPPHLGPTSTICHPRITEQKLFHLFMELLTRWFKKDIKKKIRDQRAIYLMAYIRLSGTSQKKILKKKVKKKGTAIVPCREESSAQKWYRKFTRNRVRKGRRRVAKGEDREERKIYMGRKEIFHQHQAQGQRREGKF